MGRKCPVAPESTAPSCGRLSHRALHALSAAAYLGGGDSRRVVSNWTCFGVLAIWPCVKASLEEW